MDSDLSCALVEDVGRVGIEDDEVGGRADRQPSGRKPEDFGRPRRQGAQEPGQGDAFRMDEAQGGREQGLEPDGAVRRLGEGQPLVLNILWIVVRDDHVDGAVGQRLDHRLPVVLVAQRRRELQEGAVIADVVLVERQVVDGDAAGDRQPFRLRGAHDLGRIGAVEIMAAW